MKVTATFDAMVARAVAKIAFNYLAFTQGADFALRPSFDEVRRFIRYGEGERSRFVRPGRQPVLADESRRLGFTQGHIVLLWWAAGSRLIRGRVSPFNGMVYDVCLSHDAPSVWRPIDSGHLFEWESGEILEVGSTRRNLVVPIARRVDLLLTPNP